MSVRLLKGDTQVQYLGIEGEVSVVSCNCADPYLLLHMANGQTLLITATDGGDEAHILSVSRPAIAEEGGSVVTCCLYADTKVGRPRPRMGAEESTLSSLMHLWPCSGSL